MEADPSFLGRLAIGGHAELVDEVGMLWLTRPDGWRREPLLRSSPSPRSTTKPPCAASSAVAKRPRTQRHASPPNCWRRTPSWRVNGRTRPRVAAETARLLAELDDLRQRLRTAQRADHASAQAVTKLEAELATRAPVHR